MSLLARWRGDWYLAQRARPSSHGCALLCSPLMSHGEGFTNIGGRVARQMESTIGVAFYPELRYKGYRVWPMNWHPESEEPLLLCFMDHSEISGGGWPPTEKRMKALMEDGWAWNQREGGEKYVHVDDLEKIEVPPPQGTF